MYSCTVHVFLCKGFSRTNPPLTSTWPHLGCDFGLEEGEYRENCLCITLLCISIMVYKGASSSYRSVGSIGL